MIYCRSSMQRMPPLWWVPVMMELEVFIGFQLKRLWICWARGSLVVKNLVAGWDIAQSNFLHAIWCKLANPKTDHQIPWMAKSDAWAAWTCSIPGFCKNTCETSAVAAASAIGGPLGKLQSRVIWINTCIVKAGKSLQLLEGKATGWDDWTSSTRWNCCFNWVRAFDRYFCYLRFLKSHRVHLTAARNELWDIQTYTILYKYSYDDRW